MDLVKQRWEFNFTTLSISYWRDRQLTDPARQRPLSLPGTDSACHFSG